MLSAAVGDVDAASAGGFQIDGAYLDPRGDDQAQLAGPFDGCRGHRRRPHHHHLSVVERCRQRVGLELWTVRDLHSEERQFVEGLELHLVSDDNPHGSART
jgi:hypothetical protein